MHRLLLILLLLPTSAFACSCGGDWSLDSAHANSERAAIVLVTEASLHEEASDLPEIRAIGHVVEQFKGSKVKRVKLVAFPPSNGCFEDLQIGESYVVFWRGDTAWHSACNPQVRLQSVPASTLQGWRRAP